MYIFCTVFSVLLCHDHEIAAVGFYATTCIFFWSVHIRLLPNLHSLWPLAHCVTVLSIAAFCINNLSLLKHFYQFFINFVTFM